MQPKVRFMREREHRTVRKWGDRMYCFESRVRYSEINSAKELTLPSLLDYLQDCCTFESGELGIGVDYLAREQRAWILSSWQLKIAEYPLLGEKIRICTWPYGFKGFYGYRNFLVEDARGNTLVEANSVWVFLDTGRMRPVRIPEEMLKAYEGGFDDPLPGGWEDRRIPFSGEGDRREPVQVSRFHIDTNHHMNNGKYILVAEEYLPEDFVASGLRAEYRRAALQGDLLFPCVCRGDDRVTVGLLDEEGKPYAVVQFVRKD